MKHFFILFWCFIFVSADTRINEIPITLNATIPLDETTPQNYEIPIQLNATIPQEETTPQNYENLTTLDFTTPLEETTPQNYDILTQLNATPPPPETWIPQNYGIPVQNYSIPDREPIIYGYLTQQNDTFPNRHQVQESINVGNAAPASGIISFPKLQDIFNKNG
ncbi:hypothetical protein B5X24_HaOG203806 [Helicoverpa armigera]|nr:hypothetical protein B5X24_HaOG203806 [Helicoverpa armigera]